MKNMPIRNSIYWLVSSMLLLTFALVACGGPSTSSTTPTSSTVSVTDGSGTKVTLSHPAKRIVCLQDNCMDMLANLGLVPVAALSVYFADAYPYTTSPQFFAGKSIAQIDGGAKTPNFEQIAQLNPDLVISTVGYENLRDTLKPIAPLYLGKQSNIADLETSLRDIGTLTGHSAQATTAISTFEHKFAAYKAKSPDNKTAVVFVTYTQPLYHWTTSSPLGQMLAQVTKYPWPATAGAESEAISPEQVLATNPEVIFIPALPANANTTMFQKNKAALVVNPIWKELKAVQTNQVYEVPFYWISLGLRGFGLILDQAMQTLYPSVFPKPLS